MQTEIRVGSWEDTSFGRITTALARQNHSTLQLYQQGTAGTERRDGGADS